MTDPDKDASATTNSNETSRPQGSRAANDLDHPDDGFGQNSINENITANKDENYIKNSDDDEDEDEDGNSVE